MEKRKKIMLVVLVVLLLVLFVVWPKKSNPLNTPETTDTGDDGINDDLPIVPPNITPVKPVVIPDGQSEFPLKKGSKGNRVKQLQEIINFNDSAFGQTGGVYLTADGNFGPKTESRVKAVFGSPVVTEAQFKTAVERRKNAIPYGSRMDDNFPLRLGSYGPKTEALNITLGTYKKGEPYAKNFTAKTAAAVKAKLGSQSVDSAKYYTIVKPVVVRYPNT